MCTRSESISKLAAALVAFSAEVKSISHDAVNPHYKSQYTSLDHMIDETKPILQKHGLTVLQFAGGDGEKITVRTMILHVSGEWIETEPLTLSPVKKDPQGAGSAITYARRYSYAAALSLSLGDDDDGNSASHPPNAQNEAAKPQRTQTNQNQQRSGQASAQANTGGQNMISEAQIRYSFRLKNDKHINDEDFKRMISEFADGVTDIKKMTKKQASEFINFLTAYEPEPEPIHISDDDLPF